MKLKIMRYGVVASEMTVHLLPSGDHEIAYIHTALEARGKGLASKLLERAKSKYTSLVAFLDDDGTGLTVDQMEAWYKRHGFKRVKYNLGKPWDKNIKTVMYWESLDLGVCSNGFILHEPHAHCVIQDQNEEAI